MMKENNLTDRLLNFSVDTIKYLRYLPNNEEYRIIKYQLIKSVTSSGANYEESQGGSSKKDFSNKVRISLKEMRETNYWLKVINGITEDDKLNQRCKNLIKESYELRNILGAICVKAEINK